MWKTAGSSKGRANRMPQGGTDASLRRAECPSAHLLIPTEGACRSLQQWGSWPASIPVDLTASVLMVPGTFRCVPETSPALSHCLLFLCFRVLLPRQPWGLCKVIQFVFCARSLQGQVPLRWLASHQVKCVLGGRGKGHAVRSEQGSSVLW